jgi:cyclophilin family peptidyl-prolyl cis-trans isomerase
MNWDSIETNQLNAMMQLPLPMVLKTHVADLYIKQTKQITSLLPLFKSTDVTVQAMLCESFEARLKSKIVDSSIYTLYGPYTLDTLKQFQSELYMPRDFEAYVAYEKLIKAIAHEPYHYQSWFQKGYSIPIDWHEIDLIPANQQVELITNKGRIVLQCQVNEAPASVAIFLKLIDQGYYNQKYWHRMVPNFVVQGGCPRGDGWGNLDFVQRSEWSNTLRYSPGAVGLASAGKDSEGVQFFITHTYTPHLDGRYSIIAYVVDGQAIVDAQKVGDQIISMTRL